MHERQGDLTHRGDAQRSPQQIKAVRQPAASTRRSIQPKLEVGAADDHFEREADAVARSVVARLHDDEIGRDTVDSADHEHTGTCCDHHAIGRIMRKVADVGLDGGEVQAETEQMIRSTSGGGSPLDGRVRRQMEGAFGTDFGAVRTHTGARATELNERIQAKAFTHGNDIYFRGSAPDAGSAAGQELLAHELTHTIQQSGGQSAQRITRARRRVQRAVETIGTEKVECADDTEKAEAAAIIKRISDSYGVEVSSVKTVEAVRGDYGDVPADVKATLAIKEWRMSELRALEAALANYAPILGAARATSGRKDADQEVTSVGKANNSLDVDEPTGQLDPDTLGEYFSSKKNMGLFAPSEGHVSDFPTEAEQLTATFIHEIAHGLLAYTIPGFIAISGFWKDRNTKLSKSKQTESPITSYGETNAAEDICETAMFFFLDPAKLKAKCPERHKYMTGIGTAWVPPPKTTPIILPAPDAAPAKTPGVPSGGAPGGKISPSTKPSGKPDSGKPGKPPKGIFGWFSKMLGSKK